MLRIALLIMTGLAATGGLFAQQCPTTVQQLLPTAHTSQFSLFGDQTDLDDDYLIVSATADHSVEAFSGAVFVYKSDASGMWQKIAKLLPSVVQENLRMGSALAIHDNTIIAYGQVYNALGDNLSTIFVFEKDPASEWTSGTETYRINISPTKNAFMSLDYDGTDLAVGFVEEGVDKVNLYRKVSGQFALIQQLTKPPPVGPSFATFGRDVSVQNGLLAVADSQATNSNSTGGKVYVYEYAGSAWPSSPVAVIIPAVNPVPFHNAYLGAQVLIHDNTIFALGALDTAPQLVVYEKPPAGWSDATLSPLRPVNSNSFAYHVKATGDYLFIPQQGSIQTFKKNTASWNSITLVTNIANPVESTLAFGHSIAAGSNHFVVGAPPPILFNPVGTGKALSYYSPTGNWAVMPTPQVILESSINASTDEFGFAVDNTAKYTAVGAPGDSDFGYHSGATYIFTFDGTDWVNPLKITAPLPQPIDEFGKAVKLGDSVLFVSAPSADSLLSNGSILDSNIGKVFVFRLTVSGWKYHSQILAPVLKGNGLFGQEIAWTKGQVVISEYSYSSSTEVGLVHIYQETTDHHWMYKATLKQSSTFGGDYFGRSVSMNDSTIVVGTGNPEFSSSFPMKVFVYTKKGTWKNAIEDAQLIPTTKSRLDLFGYSVSLYGDHVVVGSPGYPGLPLAIYDSDFYLRGAAFVFERPSSGWSGTVNEKATLLPSDPSRENLFGYSVAIDNNDILIGAPHSYMLRNQADHYDNSPGKFKNGKVYHYITTNHDWQSSNQELRQLFSTGPEWTDGFGVSVNVANRYLVVGCVLDDTSLGFQTGSAFVINLDPVVEDLRKPRCIEDGPVTLVGLPIGGTWTGAGFSDATSGIFNPAGLAPGRYNVSYTVLGCVAFNFVDVISAGLNVTFVSPHDQTRCSYNDISIKVESNAGPERYFWFYKQNLADAYIPLVDGTTNISTHIDGFYRSLIKHPTCYSHVEEFTIKSETAVVSIAAPPFICDTRPTTLQATPAGGTWAGPGINSTTGALSTTLADGLHSFIYTFQTPIGCQFSKAAAVTVNKILTATQITATPSGLCSNEPVKLTLGPIKTDTQISWYNVNSSTPVSFAQTLTIAEPGEFYASLLHHGCVARTASIKLTINSDTIFIPNVFTPNGDHYNDAFRITSDALNNFDLLIFDRNGKDYFRSNDSAFQWNGHDAPAGVYYWLISYINCSGLRREYKGWVQLVR